MSPSSQVLVLQVTHTQKIFYVSRQNFRLLLNWVIGDTCLFAQHVDEFLETHVVAGIILMFVRGYTHKVRDTTPYIHTLNVVSASLQQNAKVFHTDNQRAVIRLSYHLPVPTLFSATTQI